MNRVTEKRALVFYGAVLVTDVANYVFQILAGRFLSVAQFGTLNFVVTLITVCTTPCLAIRMAMAHGVAKFQGEGKPESQALLIRQGFRFTSLLSLGFLLLGGLGLWALRDRLGQNPYLLVVIVSAALYFFYFVTGIAQGLQRLLLVAGVGFVFALMKITGVLLTPLVGADRRIGLIGGMMGAGALLSAAVGAWVLARSRKDLAPKSLAGRPGGPSLFSLSYTARAFLANACIILMMNTDMILVRLTQTAEVAGLYGPAMNVARILGYAVTAVSTLLFPLVVRGHAAGENQWGAYLRALLLALGLFLLMLLGIGLLGEWMVRWVFGSAYLPGVRYLLPACLLAFSVALCNINTHYLLALGRSRMLVLTQLLSCLAAIPAGLWLGKQMTGMLLLMCGAFFAAFLINFGSIWRSSHSHLKGHV